MWSLLLWLDPKGGRPPPGNTLLTSPNLSFVRPLPGGNARRPRAGGVFLTALPVGGLYDHPRDYDVAFFDTTDLEVERLITVIERHSPTHVDSILEVGCGTGRMLRALALRNIRVGGYDVNPSMVAFAQARLMESVPAEPLMVWRVDMRHPRIVEGFDAAINVINTLGYLRDYWAIKSHFEAMVRTVPPAGLYVLQLAFAWRDLEAAKPGHWHASRGGVTTEVTWSVLSEDPVTRVSMQHSIVEVSDSLDSYVLRDDHRLRLWSLDELRESARLAGFECIGIYREDISRIPFSDALTGELGNVYVVLINVTG